MADDISIKKTSTVTLQATDLVIRETKTIRLILRPVVVDNSKHPENSVKCWIIAQRKGPNDKWEEFNELPLSRLKKGEWLKFQLKTEDVSKILGMLEAIKDQYERYGISFGGRYSLIKGEEVKLLAELARFNRSVLLSKLKNVDQEGLENLTETIKLSRLENLVKQIKEHSSRGLFT
jgi:hypothetical protein